MSNELKEKILKAQQEGDIASLYVLEQNAHEHLSDEEIEGFYANILDLALEKLTETLEAHRQMDISEVQDFATLRALYEYAIEHYHAGQNKDASALFEVLSGLSNDAKFSKAMKMHQIAADENIDIDNFLDKIADIELTQQYGTFYISEFQKEAQKLLDNA
ncbi:hypothetical protein [Sulfurimonas sp. C5]|uniref:hypothetical protein n=1 Tax=Sulfurimonas sp. C5 TaxID=3036947 RepID=UPI0024577E19|nr:hypothetical protein [Sulfurimonas sp. C5]MDH4944245.1 hypothetical protein [Sulfurimonas sp. C5]